MRRKLPSVTICFLFLTAVFISVDMGLEVVTNSSGRVITVGHYKMYPTIQQGIDNASHGDTVIVYFEDYYENIVVDKSINLISEGAGIWGTYPGMPGMPMLQDNLVTITADYVNISGFDIFFSEHAGIEVWSNYNNISNNNLLETHGGSVVLHGDFNKVENNRVYDGMMLYNSDYNIITYNDVSNTLTEDGIMLYSSNENYIEHNIVGNNAWGIYLEDSQNNTLKDNLVSYCGYNKYGEDGWGISLWSSQNNEIYHNDIIENIKQAYDDNPGINFWDNGYPDGGNYWSDYNGEDIFNGPNQDIPGSDGIGDTNYTINSEAVDNYPLMGRYTNLIGSCSAPKADAGPDLTVYVNFTVRFDGWKSKDSDGYIDMYKWDFGDGSPLSYKKVVNHVYDKIGIYTVLLTVMDDDGITDTDCCVITVIERGDSIPIAEAGSNQTLYIGEVVYFDGSGSYDPDSFWEIETIDSPFNRGAMTSIAMDSNDYPHISYHDYSSGSLRYVKWNGLNWQFDEVDRAYIAGRYTSLALDSNDYPHISHSTLSNGLRYSHWTGSEWINEFVEYTKRVIQLTSIAINSTDSPHIIYNKGVLWAKKNGSLWDIENIDPLVTDGGWSSIVFDANDNPHVSYQVSTVGNGLKYAKWNGSGWDIDVVDSDGIVGDCNSLELDTQGNPHISFYDRYNRDLKYARWNGSEWINETVDSTGDVGRYTSLELDLHGNPHISYYDFTNGDLKYARWVDNAWVIETLDTYGDVGMWSSLALDSEGFPHISYYDNTYDDLKYAKKVKGVLSYEWDFGDGTPAENNIATSHLFNKSGTYNVTLTVTDEAGYTDSDICIVTVLEKLPFANAGQDQYVYLGETVKFNGSGSYDPYISWKRENVDSETAVYGVGSIEIDSSGNPHIIYFDGVNRELKYAKQISDTWQIETVYDSLAYGYGSLALDSKDNPHIIFRCYNNGVFEIRYGKFIGGTWQFETIDYPSFGAYSIALDTNDNPHISYFRRIGMYGSYELRYAKLESGVWTIESVESGDIGEFVCLAVDSDKNPHISYYRYLNDDLRYAVRINNIWQITTVDSNEDVGAGNSLALDSNDDPHISYLDKTNNNVKYARWVGNSWSLQIVDSTDSYKGGTSLALESENNPHISYPDITNKYQLYAKRNGSSWAIQIIDLRGYIPYFTAPYDPIALDSTGRPFITYVDSTNNELRLAKWCGGLVSYDWDFGDGSLQGRGERTTHLYNTPGIYNVTLTVTDYDGNVDTDTCIITVIAPSASIYLTSGWNLISLPNIQNETDIQTVLQSIEGDYDALQWYDASDSCDPWKHYHVSKPSYLNDLSEIDHEMGFWIHVTREGGTILYSVGDRPTSPRFLNLHLGWNLVGYPSNISMTRDEALNSLFFGTDIDCVQYFDSTEGKLKTVGANDLMEPGKGYYIHAQTDCVWEVPL